VIVVNDPGPDELSASFDAVLALTDAVGNCSNQVVTVTLNAP
jgi:hypothetical protein